MSQTISLWTQDWIKKQSLYYCYKALATSSNDLAKQEAFTTLISPSIFLVDQQSQGRGCGNNIWENSDLMMSVLWNKNLKDVKTLNAKNYMLDVYQSLKHVWPCLDIYVKEPNDLYLNDKKQAGILLEILDQGSQIALIVGLGLNVFSYPKNINATCLNEARVNITIQTWQKFLTHLLLLWNQTSIIK